MLLRTRITWLAAALVAGVVASFVIPLALMTTFPARALRTKSVSCGPLCVRTSCARRPPAIQKPVGSG